MAKCINNKNGEKGDVSENQRKKIMKYLPFREFFVPLQPVRCVPSGND